MPESRPSPTVTDGDNDNLLRTNTVVDSVRESRDGTDVDFAAPDASGQGMCSDKIFGASNLED
jgi:hypothetical protein